jgi:hypothetical protein
MALSEYPNLEENNPNIKKYIAFGVKNPNLLGFTISNVKWFLDNNSVTLRREAFTNALLEYNLDLDVCEDKIEEFSSNSNKVCSNFLNEGYPSLTETVALTRLSLYLYSFESGSSGKFTSINTI